MTAILSGSSSCLRDQLFAYNEWGKYPSLNDTLFSLTEITPLRTINQMTKYLQAVGFTTADELSPENILHLSGGVGRVIELVCKGNSNPRGSLYWKDLVLSNSVFTILATQMFDTDSNGKITEVAAHTILKEAGFNGIQLVKEINILRDGGVLYLIKDGVDIPHIEFMYPYHATEVRDYLSGTANIRDMINAHTQLYGINGSLGHSLERLCRVNLKKLFL